MGRLTHGSDVFGRRWAFNLTIGITATWGLIAAGSPNFAALACFASFWSFGVGQYPPFHEEALADYVSGKRWKPTGGFVRSFILDPQLILTLYRAIFLEALPAQQQYLLTVLSIFWALAQLLATLIAWPLLGYHTCGEKETNCTKSKNFGWRYFMIAMGLIALAMFALRFIAFTLYESPKYLMGKGREEEAVAVVHKIAAKNRKTSTLMVDQLTAYNDRLGGQQGTDARAALARRLEKVNLTHIRSLFASRKLGIATVLLTIVWAFIGLGFPLYNAFLPYIQAQRGAEFGDGSTYITYRNSLIIAVLGVPGAILGGVLVEIPRFGRKGALSVSTALTGVFLFASTTAVTSDALLGWNCAYNFMSNIMYAVLYAL